MARLKLLVFALPALGLWVAKIYLDAPRAAVVAERQASARLDRAVDGARASLAERSAALYQLQGKLEMDADVWSAVPKPTRSGALPALTQDTFEAVRAAVLAATPKPLQAVLSLSLAQPDGAFSAVGTAAPVAGAAPAVDAPAPQERTAPIGKVLYHQIPIVSQANPGVVLTVGLPVVPAELADSLAGDGSLSAVALLSHTNALVQSAGPKRDLLVKAMAQLSAGELSAESRGAALALGPLKLPLLTSGDWLGGKAPLTEMGRRSVSGTAFDVAALVSTHATMAAEAGAQKRALLMFGVLVILWLLCTVLLRAPKQEQAPAMVVGDMTVTRKSQVSPATSAPTVVAPVAEPVPSGPLGLEAPPPPEEASPDDFDFGGVLGKLPPPPMDPPPSATTAAPPPEPPAAAANPFDDEKTSLYPSSMQRSGLSAGIGDDEPPEEPEATRVAAIPSELLRASVRRGEEISIPNRAPPPPSMASSLVDTDEVHFQEVYQDFLATRENCGEQADGLTYDKFAVKLRKNRDQLTQKYACRTVRFQVYVKEGKAALKATPVKD